MNKFTIISFIFLTIIILLLVFIIVYISLKHESYNNSSTQTCPVFNHKGLFTGKCMKCNKKINVKYPPISYCNKSFINWLKINNLPLDSIYKQDRLNYTNGDYNYAQPGLCLNCDYQLIHFYLLVMNIVIFLVHHLN